MSELENDDCKRVCVTINGENYYFIVGKNFISATVPRENDLAMSRDRNLIDELCRGITLGLGGDV